MKGNVAPIVRKKREKVRESLVPGQVNYVPVAPTTNNVNGNVNGIGEERDEGGQAEKVG